MQIERSIPIPPKAKRGRPAKGISLALKQMTVGQSFWTPGYTEVRATSLHTQARRAGKKIVTRRTVIGGKEGIRVWVVERTVA